MDTLIIGQGLAGSALAWNCHWQGDRVQLLAAENLPMASSIAAGLVMPIYGHKYSIIERFKQRLEVAEGFFRQVEQHLNTDILFRPLRILRRFRDAEDRRFFLQERYESVGGWVQLQLGEDGQATGFVMPGWKLNVPSYLAQTRQYFRNRGQFLAAELEIGTDVVPGTDQVQLPRLGLVADRLFFCQGAGGSQQWNPWFPGVPDHPLRGEILQISAERVCELSGAAVSSGGWDAVVDEHWLVPVEGVPGHFLVGATYDRERVTIDALGSVGGWDGTTASGQKELSAGAQRLLYQGGFGAGQHSVISHRAGIRAGTRRRQVLAAYHTQQRRLGILNGLGSHGTLLAPAAAAELLRQFDGGCGQVTEQTEPVVSGTVRRRSGLTEKAQTIVRRAVRGGDWLLDATAGNGHDTVFLARLAGPQRVLAVDLQSAAIEKTGLLLAQEGLAGVGLVTANHADELERLLVADAGVWIGRFGAVMFNLGYLPGGDHVLVTQADTTVRALRAACQLLRAEGVLTVLCYRGHAGGPEEYSAVREEASRQQQQFQVDEIAGGTGNPTAPVLFVFRRNATVRE